MNRATRLKRGKRYPDDKPTGKQRDATDVCLALMLAQDKTPLWHWNACG